MMRWQPRRCGGMTTDLWAQRAAKEPGAEGAEEASSHRTAARRGRAEAAMEREEKMTGAGAVAAACMVGFGGGDGGDSGLETRLFLVLTFVWVRVFFFLLYIFSRNELQFGFTFYDFL